VTGVAIPARDLRPSCNIVTESRLIQSGTNVKEVSPYELKEAVEAQHGGTAKLVETVPVHETYGNKTVWKGTVHVFDLAGHPRAKRAYAWSSEIEGSLKRRFFSVLHIPPIVGPVEAVRAAIVAERRAKS
jgi:hypothetical protein